MTHHTGLENRRSGNATEGSNPSLSADLRGFPDKDDVAHDAPFTPRSADCDGANGGTGDSCASPDSADIQDVYDLIILKCEHDPTWTSRGAKALRTINALVDTLEGALGCIESLTSQFDHAGCTCTFPDDDCCAFARADALVASGRSLIVAPKDSAA